MACPWSSIRSCHSLGQTSRPGNPLGSAAVGPLRLLEAATSFPWLLVALSPPAHSVSLSDVEERGWDLDISHTLLYRFLTAGH